MNAKFKLNLSKITQYFQSVTKILIFFFKPKMYIYKFKPTFIFLTVQKVKMCLPKQSISTTFFVNICSAVFFTCTKRYRTIQYKAKSYSKKVYLSSTTSNYTVMKRSFYCMFSSSWHVSIVIIAKSNCT